MSDYHFSLRLDANRNVVYLTQKGAADLTHLEQLREEYRRVLQGVKPGFVLVHDQSKVESMTDEALEVAQDLVALTNEFGASKVIRISSEALALRSRVSRVLVSGQFRYQHVRVATLEAAEQHLRDNPPTKGG